MLHYFIHIYIYTHTRRRRGGNNVARHSQRIRATRARRHTVSVRERGSGKDKHARKIREKRYR